MMALRLGTACCATVAMVVAVPTASQAASRSVDLGPPASAAKAFQKTSADVNAFFPKIVTIHVGDSVRFVPTGFHTVHFPGRSGKPTAPIVPTGKTVTGATDAAGVPLPFNGLPELGLNRALFNPHGKFGKTIVTNGTREIQSALPLTNKPKPMTVRFTKAGTFNYVCDLHIGMKGTVRVVSKHKRISSAAAVAKRVKRQVASDLKTAKALAKASSPANTIDLGRIGSGAVTLYAFAPSTLTVPVGTTVTFKSASGDGETHTATTGPGDPAKDPKSFLGVLAASLNSPVPDQSALYPSDFGAPAALTPTLHGNGFWNGGVQDGSSRTSLPSVSHVTFSAAGTYRFYCMLHPFMHATIIAK